MASQNREGMCLRLPPKLKAAVRTLARDNGRSMTKEIELAVQNHVTPAKKEQQ